MKKIISIIFVSLLLAALLVPAVFAAAYPSWYPEDVSSFSDFHGTNLPRVVDDADILSASDEAELTKQINALIEKFGYKYDFVIFTDNTNYGIGKGMTASDGVYPADFYQFNGYGYGDDYSGSVFFVCMEPGNRYWWSAGRGKTRSFFTETNINSIDDIIEPYMRSGDYAGAMFEYVKLLDELYSNGKIAKRHTVGVYVVYGCIAAVIGLIVGGVNVSKQKANMNRVRFATYANDYIVQNSFVLRNMSEMFLYKNVTRTVIESSSRSGGGGGSSYSGGYHSSGGGSFSGGGRHF